jgi:hypothetical protein
MVLLLLLLLLLPPPPQLRLQSAGTRRQLRVWQQD